MKKITFNLIVACIFDTVGMIYGVTTMEVDKVITSNECMNSKSNVVSPDLPDASLTFRSLRIKSGATLTLCPGQSGNLYIKVRDTFHIEPGGKIDLKGRGESVPGGLTSPPNPLPMKWRGGFCVLGINVRNPGS